MNSNEAYQIAACICTKMNFKGKKGNNKIIKGNNGNQDMDW